MTEIITAADIMAQVVTFTADATTHTTALVLTDLVELTIGTIPVITITILENTCGIGTIITISPAIMTGTKQATGTMPTIK